MSMAPAAMNGEYSGAASQRTRSGGEKGKGIWEGGRASGKGERHLGRASGKREGGRCIDELPLGDNERRMGKGKGRKA